MLTALYIRDVVLIDSLDLPLHAGFSALTGETGAGKSILLDALGLALGARADTGLVRRGATQAVVTAQFSLPDSKHPARLLCEAHGIAGDDEFLILRRLVTMDGRSKAFVNDQPVGVGLLKELGEKLIEVHGQFQTYGLLDVSTHRGVLDNYGNHAALLAELSERLQAWRKAEAALKKARAAKNKAEADAEWLEHSVAELDEIEPEADEEEILTERRAFLASISKLVEEGGRADTLLSGKNGSASTLAQAQRILERVTDKASGRFDDVLDGLARADAELDEARRNLSHILQELPQDAETLDKIEERLFLLRALARKHGVAVAGLYDLHQELRAKLAGLSAGEEILGNLIAEAKQTREAYIETATALSVARQAAAQRLDKAVMVELPPLKLERAQFFTTLQALPEAEWSEFGMEKIMFQVATNLGGAAGPLHKIASGGELSRFMLAVKLALAEIGETATLVFDEIDAGVGGATAAAIGARLSRLGKKAQVLSVTHSPQIAASSDTHYRVRKQVEGDQTVTGIVALSPLERREEVARMLAGAEITDEARAAAGQLMNPPAPVDVKTA